MSTAEAYTYHRCMAPRATARDRTEQSILDATARLFAERGRGVSMADIAAAAAVGRATLYRYFPTRDALERGLVVAGVDELAQRITDAGLESVPTREALARFVRAFLNAGRKYAALTEDDKTRLTGEVDFGGRVIRPLRDLLERGVRGGDLRPDVDVDLLFELLSALLAHGVRLIGTGSAGVEQASAAIVSLVLDGAAAEDMSGRGARLAR